MAHDPATEAVEPPEFVRTAIVGDIPMRWEEHDGGAPDAAVVVLVHGLPTNPRAWRHVVPLLARDDVRCLAWEQVGFGGSLEAGRGRDLSIPAEAGYLRAWLNELGIGRAVFVGHDYGGGVVQQLLLDAPELFDGLVLVDCVAFDNWPVAAVRAARMIRPLIGRLPPMLVYPLFRAALLNLGHTDRRVAAESAELFWCPYARAGGPAAFAHQLQHFRNEQTRRIGERLAPISCPASVVWGERDPLGLPSARKLADRLAAPLRVIPGARHFTPDDHPEEVAEALRQVLAEARSRS